MKILALSLATTAVAAALIGAGITPAHAQFAEFTNAKYKFTNAGAASGLVTGTGKTAASVPVTFVFNEFAKDAGGDSYKAGQSIAAFLIESATVSGTATGSQAHLNQPLGLTSYVFTDSHGRNLLTVTSDTTDLLKLGSKSGVDAADSADGTDVLYTSDFLKFTPTAEGYGNFQSNLGLSGKQILTKNANGYLNTFTATGGGSFHSYADPAPVPEASTMVSMSLLLALGLGGLAATRRKTQVKAGAAV